MGSCFSGSNFEAEADKAWELFPTFPSEFNQHMVRVWLVKVAQLPARVVEAVQGLDGFGLFALEPLDVDTHAPFYDLPPTLKIRLLVALGRLRDRSHNASNEEILAFYSHAIELSETTGNVTTLESAVAHHRAAELYMRLGQLDQAEQLLKEALVLRIGIQGMVHMDIATCYMDLGRCLTLQEQYRDALEEQIRGLSILMKRLEYRHLDVAAAYEAIGQTYEKLRQPKEALTVYKKALDIRLSIIGDADADETIAFTRQRLGAVLSSLGKFEESLDEFSEALRIRLQLHGSKHKSVELLYFDIARAFRKERRLESAIRYYRKWMEIRRFIYGPDHISVAEALSTIADVYTASNIKAVELEDIVVEECRVRAATKEGDPMALAKAYHRLAAVQSRNKKIGDSLESLKKASSIFELNDNGFTVAAGNVYADMSRVYKYLGNDAESQEAAAKAFAIRRSAYGDSDPSVVHLSNMAGLKMSPISFDRESSIQKISARTDFSSVGDPF